MPSTSGLVLVTGATEFIGSHIVSQLLEKNIRVRAVVRSTSKVKTIFPDTGSQLEIVEVPSLLDDHTEALKGVSAVIHTAVPGFFNGASNEETLRGAYAGALNIVNQAISIGIKKIVVTGSFLDLFDTDFKQAYGDELVTEIDFGSIELADIKPEEQDAVFVYQAAKTVVDKRLLQIARENSDVDVTVLLPSMVFGPFVPNFPYPSNISQLGTNAIAYGLIAGGPDGPNTYPSLHIGHLVDVHDVAKAHVLALDAPPVPGRHKRMIVYSGIFKWKDAAEVIRKTHPELAPRLPSSDAAPPAQTDAPLDISFTSEVLGMRKYVPWEESVVAAIEVCLEHERRFKN
ncbi:3-beta hydroxysteroid dehydrogenase isomerase family protein [Moniliophthora roreri MCA 2997]|uniref:3-beta hydroxysteroid dehydrogenase isomerase family protein n=1 Tax=Moniliophthora roreri (strain MCA 2997) TaxID=1381753 RepID=V2WKQ5_MONRO|nr:3-beta hydroxysteroid dehydrogenase isomerase family protein [Moniliophthora roreri MCA 2997]